MALSNCTARHGPVAVLQVGLGLQAFLPPIAQRAEHHRLGVTHHSHKAQCSTGSHLGIRLEAQQDPHQFLRVVVQVIPHPLHRGVVIDLGVAASSRQHRHRFPDLRFDAASQGVRSLLQAVFQQVVLQVV